MPTAAAMATRPPRAIEDSRFDAAAGDGPAPMSWSLSPRYAAPGFAGTGSELVRRHLAQEAGQHEHAQPVHARGSVDHVVHAHGEQGQLVPAEALLGIAARLRIIGPDVDPPVEHEVDLVELWMVVGDGGLDVRAYRHVELRVVGRRQD